MAPACSVQLSDPATASVSDKAATAPKFSIKSDAPAALASLPVDFMSIPQFFKSFFAPNVAVLFNKIKNIAQTPTC